LALTRPPAGIIHLKNTIMPVMKVIELMGASDKSWEDATQMIVLEASKTLGNIRSVYIQDLSARVDNNKVVEYRVNAKVTFEVKGK
jgi:dodecin